MKEIKGEQYKVNYKQESTTINFEGSLRRMGMTDYQPIENFMNEILDQNLGEITLDLCELVFLNSAGFRMLSKFVIAVRKQAKTQIVVKGNQAITWQNTSLKNLQKLMPSLILKWD